MAETDGVPAADAVFERAGPGHADPLLELMLGDGSLGEVWLIRRGDSLGVLPPAGRTREGCAPGRAETPGAVSRGLG